MSDLSAVRHKERAQQRIGKGKNMSEKIYDMLIIGSGPAGMGAALYAARAGLSVAVIERAPVAGGQIINTMDVDNYLGLPGIGGFEMGDTFRQHVERFECDFIEDDVISVEEKDGIKTAIGNKASYNGQTLVFAMGASRSKLGIPGEEEFTGKGVSYCATCDGNFFRNKETVVIGGGDVAVEDAIYLANLCKSVTLVHRRDELRAAKSIQDKLMSYENVHMEWNSVADHIDGETKVNSITLNNVKDKTQKTIPADGVFIAVGMKPDSEIAAGLCELDERGYIKAGENCETSAPGIYAAGDIRTKEVRQVITAVADGACAVSSAVKYLREKENI